MKVYNELTPQVHQGSKDHRPGQRGLQGLKGDLGGSGGVVYTRWGRSDCPKSAKIVYSGNPILKLRE